MEEKLTTYDPATALVSDEEIAFFMADALQTGNAAYITKAQEIVARAKSMFEISGQALATSGSVGNWIVISAVPMADVAVAGVCRRPSRPGHVVFAC